MRRTALVTLMLSIGVVLTAQPPVRKASPPKTMRLYVFDCGMLNITPESEYDVFGDGKAVIKAAPGHTPGHQMLVLQLASTGRSMIAGDLYHYPPERMLHRAPPDNEFNVQQSASSRAMIEEYLTKTNATVGSSTILAPTRS